MRPLRNDPTGLPVHASLEALTVALGDRHVAVLEAPPGAGKTTLIPLALLDADWLQGQKMLLLAPRRLAARAAAERMADQLGEAVGRTVGYRVRLESRVSPTTRIEVITEGILTRQLQADPALEGIGLVIFDEFHERSLDGDLGLALTLQSRELLRDTEPLRLLVMSATLDGARVAQLLDGAPVIRSEGRQHPVEIHYGDPRTAADDPCARVAATLRDVLAREPGSVLVFLPGQREIRRVAELTADLATPTLQLLPLHGELDLAAQRRVIEPAAPGTRKVVLATSIAETSLTIDGIRVVIDAGLSRLPQFDPRSGMTRLQTRPLSRASSEQRAGRAGRIEPGTCYRLWSPTQQSQLVPFAPPEMAQADLASLALQLLRWGAADPAELRWLDPPPAAPYTQALELLQRLGAVTRRDGRWQLTGHGEAMAHLPAHPRLGHLLLVGARFGLLARAADLAALIAERDPFRIPGSDLQPRLEQIAGHGARGAVRRLQQLAAQFRRMVEVRPSNAVDDPDDPRWTGFLVAVAYPDRIAQRRGNRYTLSNGRAAQLPDGDPLHSASHLAVAQLGGQAGRATDRIFLAAELDAALFNGPLADLVDELDRIDWDREAGRFRAERRRCCGALVLERRPLTDIPAGKRRDVLLDLVRREGLALLDWPDHARQLRGRVALLHRVDLARHAQSEWPDLGDAALLERLPEWLGPALDNVRHLDDFRTLDVGALLHSLLPWPLPQRLDELAPERIRVPSGNTARIDYTVEPPVLAVKLQEMFGCAETPRVAGGRVAVVIHLLSPARRPLQVTQDLAGFWRGSYAEVRKEMRGRYPKHPWPENPLQAPPTARTRRRSNH